jgi:hypothetical protein
VNPALPLGNPRILSDTEKVNSGRYKDAKGSLEIKFREDEGLLLALPF